MRLTARPSTDDHDVPVGECPCSVLALEDRRFTIKTLAL
jgi:hypothetical protein